MPYTRCRYICIIHGRARPSCQSKLRSGWSKSPPSKSSPPPDPDDSKYYSTLQLSRFHSSTVPHLCLVRSYVGDLVCNNISIPSLFVQCALVQYNRQCTLKPKRRSCRDEVTKKLWMNCCQSPDTGCHRIKIHHTWLLLNFYKSISVFL